MAVDPTPFYRDVATTRPRFGLIAFRNIQPTADPPYLVKGLVPREGLTVVWGPPKSGKSFWTFDLGMSLRLEGRDVVFCSDLIKSCGADLACTFACAPADVIDNLIPCN